MDTIVEKYNVEENHSERTVTDYLLQCCTILPSKKSIIKALKRGDISVDGVLCRKDTIITPGQTISVLIHNKPPGKIFPLSLNVEYNDQYVAVVEKVPGFPVNGNKFCTIENALLYNIAVSSEPDALFKPRPVHRLDRSTGGLLIVAKTMKGLTYIGKQFEQRKVMKKYRLIVAGHLTDNGTINKSLDNKYAQTGYRALGSWRSLKNDYLTLVEAIPVTGRYHQLRRHFAGAGYPVVGDTLYGQPGNILKGKGLFLWATEISFEHPYSFNKITVTIRQPKKFITLLAREERRWKKYQK